MDKKSGKIIFGPVPSRRLGRSLGVDILPLKTCNLNCIYCELGPTKTYTQSQCRLTSPQEIEDAFRQFLSQPHQPFDILTVTASGEPTLHEAIGEILARLKGIAPTPLALLTNSTMLWKDDVRRALGHVDVILPSLDAGQEHTFKRINRPASGVDFDMIIQGLESLKGGFSGKILLEVLFVSGINDSPEEVQAIKDHIERIDPNEVQVSTISRPPAETWAKPIARDRLMEIARAFGPRARIVTSFHGPKDKDAGHTPSRQELMELLKRRPLNEDDVQALFAPYHREVIVRLHELLNEGLLKEEIVEQKKFFVVRD